MSTLPVRPRLIAILAAIAMAFTACAGQSELDGGRATAKSDQWRLGTVTGRQLLTILVTNDDGVGAPGIDALVEGLRSLPDTRVIVVAPLDNRSGSGSASTDGPLGVRPAQTASGYPARAVDGFPADAVRWALDDHGVDAAPDLVIAGLNAGANLGPRIAVSGTVGAARAAALRGVPALAASQGLGGSTDWATGVDEVLHWVTANRDRILLAHPGAAAQGVVNINIPTCSQGTVAGPVTVPAATTDHGLPEDRAIACSGPTAVPSDDVLAFQEGFVTESSIPIEPGA